MSGLAKAEEYKSKGNEEYRKNNFNEAKNFYTEGIKMNCKDDKLNAQLYNNRATAQFYLGEFSGLFSLIISLLIVTVVHGIFVLSISCFIKAISSS